MGILPLEFEEGDSVDSLGISGTGTYDLLGVSSLSPKCRLTLVIHQEGHSREIHICVRIDTAGELDYYRAGGILNLVLQHMNQ